MSEDTGGPEPPDDNGAWAELTDEILALGSRLRQTYAETVDGKGPTEEEVRQALSTLGRAWNHMAGAFGVAIQDREVRQHLRRAAGSLASAVATTLEEFMPREPPGDGSAPPDVDGDIT
jgi:hypothetical protein